MVYRKGALSVCGLAFVAGSPAVAQDSRALEDIVVTARKQSESLLSVPVSVTAIGSAEIQRSAASDIGQIARIAPQIAATRTNSGTGATFTIRGIGSPSLDAGLEQSVLVDIDNIQIGRGRIVSQGLFDLAQVEVLKGPQALFFGKNSPAGVISVKSAGPGDKLEGYVRGGYEFKANERFLEGAIGGPITPTLGARIALRGSQMDGWIRNVAQAGPNPLDPTNPLPGAPNNRSPGTKELVGRLTVAWTPSSDFDATLKVLGSRLRDNGDAGSVEAYCAPGLTQISVYGVPDPYSDCRLDDRKSAGGINPALAAGLPNGRDGGFYTRGHTWLNSLSANYSVGDVTLSSVTGYYYYKVVPQDNFDDTVYAAILSNNPETNKSFTQELRATSNFEGPINFTVGGFYEDTKRELVGNIRLAYLPPDPVTGRTYTLLRLGSDKNRATSLFGQLRWSILDNLELAGGARWTKEDKKVRLENAYVHTFVAAGFLPAGQVLSGKFRDENISPEVTLNWHPQQNMTIYAAYKTGYKSGGFANPTILTPGANLGPVGAAGTLRFDSEKAKGGELGFKAKLLDNSLRVELTVFRYDFDKLQVVSFDAPSVSFLIGNAAKARTEGVEGSAEWRATPQLRLNGGFGYAKANYRSYLGAPCTSSQTAVDPSCTQDLSGRPLPRAPRLVLTGGAVYDAELSSAMNIELNADVKYTSSYFAQENQDINTFQTRYLEFNAGAKLYIDGGWELSLIGRNLTNRRPITYTNDKALGLPGEYEATRLRPRQVMIQGAYRF